jgi:hypothetical protein
LSVKYGKPVYDVDARWHKTRCPLFWPRTWVFSPATTPEADRNFRERR